MKASWIRDVRRSWLRSLGSAGCGLAISWGVVQGQDASELTLDVQVTEPVGEGSTSDVDTEKPVRSICPSPNDPKTGLKPLSAIPIGVKPTPGVLPEDCTQTLFTQQVAAEGLEVNSQFHWQPTNFFHQPLYFDDQPLERYGQTVHPLIQPAMSGTKFFATFPIVPYKMGFQGIHDCVTPMGYYRPGSCVPALRERYPFTWKGALLEAGVASGMVFGLP